ncbi:hypothetical protein TBR22_A43200 [Luteitalea sp. TBR-22]|uniref:response regulator n=1 Tax=Luteitalea sp. TBR-22 TaxID=2802971 RepID=UPI001AF15078|nr:response regulator [Luteitalea sp. TBR-22]BCS35094.1 hypothetical protein TBR22_A43200 [Luteitalea sp. TBR-22]
MMGLQFELGTGAAAGEVASAIVLGAAVAAWWRRLWQPGGRRAGDLDLELLLQHYDGLLGMAHDVMLVLDEHGGVVQVNDRATELYGYSREELLRLNIRDLRAPHTIDQFLETWALLQQDGRARFETVHRHRDGRQFAVEVNVRVIRLSGRRYFHGIISDLTARRQAEARVIRLDRLHALLSHCGRVLAHPADEVALCQRICEVAAEHGRFRIASVAIADAVSGVLQTVASAGPGAGYLDHVSIKSTDEPLGHGPAGTCLRTGTSVICQDIQRDPRMEPWRQAASTFHLSSSIALPLRREGRTVGVLSFYAEEPEFFDSEELQLAEELAASLSFALDSVAHRERIERVLDAMNEGYWDYDTATGETHISPRVAQLLGYERDALASAAEAWPDLIHEADRSLVVARIQELLGSASSALLSVEFRVRRKAGGFVWVLGRARAVAADAQFGHVRLVGTLTDITERKALEDQFLQSQKLETVGRLAGGVAHDFNNVLTVVNGYSDLLLGRMAADDPCRQGLEAIRQAGERAGGITRQLLTFSRKHASQPSVVSLADAVREIEPLARGVLSEAVKLTTRVLATDDRVFVDPGHLHQVFMNLVVNARDAMPRGGALVIETSEEDVPASASRPEIAAGRYLCVTVSDTGEGMDAATRHRIFEPFFTTKELGRGTGLGLSTVYGIVRQSGGFIDVQSEPGAGTSFRVYLPPATPAGASSGPADARPAPIARGTETILVVEDQRDVREVTVAALRAWGYTVLPAASGDEAMKVAERHEGRIDLLLTDVIMPGMHGHALAQRLTAARPSMRTIYMSGYPDDVLGPNHILGADVHYLPKPFTPERLVASVREALGPAAPRPTVLVVDDDPDVRRLFADALGDRYGVLLAGDGLECMELIRGGALVDLVIIDLFMPRQDGTQTIQAIRAVLPTVPVVAISGVFGGQFLGSVERAGVAATLTKPISVDVLRATVARHCRALRVATPQ